jgi:hypothetical protein
LLSAGFESVNLGSNGKHDTHYTTKNDNHPCSSKLVSHLLIPWSRVFYRS